MANGNPSEESEELLEACLCYNIRKATRGITQVYDDLFRPLKVRVTQVCLLHTVRSKGECTIGQLAAKAMVDSTALSRMLRPLERNGWLTIRPGGDRRERLLSVTIQGEELLKSIAPGWNDAQNQLKERLGAELFDELIEVLHRVNERISETESKEKPPVAKAA